MNYMMHHATKIIHRTDGVKVWWWSANRGVWFPDMNCTPEILDNNVATGNGSWVDNPEAGDTKK